MKKLSLPYRLLVMMVLVTVLLSACSPAATPAAPAAPTEAPKVEPTAAPTEAPNVEPTAEPTGEKKLILATTSSTQDSGLLDYLLPMYTQETGVKVDVIAVGTGQALQLGKDGNADVLLVHARAKEDEFMKNNDGVRREDVMYNDFIIVGPQEDPAKIKDMATAADAFKAISDAKAKFVSRGDDSGTHTKEKGIWAKIEVEPTGEWYISAGQNMGATLTMADEQQAYTLSDRATYLAMTKEGLKLEILVQGGKDLLNPYGVIAVNPNKSPKIQAELANQFIDWIISVPVQEKIAEFGKKEFGQSLFVPQSKPYMDAQAAAKPAAGLKITGKVGAEQSWTEEQLKAMETMEAEAKNKSGEMEKYTGVSLKKLLELAAPAADAATLVLVADDGFTNEVALKDALACDKCIVSFRSKGGFSMVMPDFPNKAQVKGVIEIQVK